MGAKSEKVSYEEALNMIGFGRYNYQIVAVCSTIMISIVLENFSVSFIVPASACELQTNSYQQGLAAGLPLVGVIITSPFWGYIADTRGRKITMIMSLVLAFTCGSLASLSPNWIVLCIFKLLSCSCTSGSYAVSFTILSECTPANKRSIVTLLASTLYLTSNGIMAVTAIPILPMTFSYHVAFLGIYLNSWRLLNFLFSSSCAIGAIVTFTIFESPKYHLSNGREDKALEILKEMYKINSGKHSDDFKVSQLVLNEDGAKHHTTVWSSITSQFLPLVKPPLIQRTLLLSTLYALIYFCVNSFIVWLPLMSDLYMTAYESGYTGLTFCAMLRTAQNITSSNIEVEADCSLNQFAMLIILGLSLILATLNLFLSGLVNWCGRKKLLIFIQLTSGISGLCINTTTTAPSSFILLIIFLCGCLNFAILTTYSVDFFPTYLKAMAVSLTLMTGRASAILGVNLLKDLLVNNCEAAFYIFAGISVVGGAVGFLLPADNKKQE